MKYPTIPIVPATRLPYGCAIPLAKEIRRKLIRQDAPGARDHRKLAIMCYNAQGWAFTLEERLLFLEPLVARKDGPGPDSVRAHFRKRMSPKRRLKMYVASIPCLALRAELAGTVRIHP